MVHDSGCTTFCPPYCRRKSSPAFPLTKQQGSRTAALQGMELNGDGTARLLFLRPLQSQATPPLGVFVYRPTIGIPTQTQVAIPGQAPPAWTMGQLYVSVLAAEGAIPWLIPLLRDLETLRL